MLDIKRRFRGVVGRQDPWAVKAMLFGTAQGGLGGRLVDKSEKGA